MRAVARDRAKHRVDHGPSARLAGALDERHGVVDDRRWRQPIHVQELKRPEAQSGADCGDPAPRGSRGALRQLIVHGLAHSHGAGRELRQQAPGRADRTARAGPPRWPPAIRCPWLRARPTPRTRPAGRGRSRAPQASHRPGVDARQGRRAPAAPCRLPPAAPARGARRRPWPPAVRRAAADSEDRARRDGRKPTVRPRPSGAGSGGRSGRRCRRAATGEAHESDCGCRGPAGSSRSGPRPS